MNILLTGATGFIGLNILESLLGAGHDVTAIAADRMPALARDAFAKLPGRMNEQRLDVRDRTGIEQAVRDAAPHTIIAAAAITAGATRELASPADILEVNLVAAVRMVELAARHGVPRVICFSSTAAMGDAPFRGQPVSESHEPEPITHYGISKAAIEASARRWRELTRSTGGPHMLVARLSAVFGPWERDSGVRDTLSPLHWLVGRAVAGLPIAPLPAGGDRDWAYAPYVAAAVHWLATATNAPDHPLYNVSSGAVWHPRLLVQALAEVGLPVAESAAGAVIPFHDDVTRKRSPLSVARLGAAFQAPPDTLGAVRAFARWVSSHRDWYAVGNSDPRVTRA